MISRLNSTGHEFGGTLGIAIFATIAAGEAGAMVGPQAATGISHAFLIAALLSGLTSIAAPILLPSARHFPHRLHLKPSAMLMH